MEKVKQLLEKIPERQSSAGGKSKKWLLHKAGVAGFEPATCGFGDRCSPN
jgi:hypothetical protein